MRRPHAGFRPEPVSPPGGRPPPDAVIVLGAAVVAPGVPGPALSRRVAWGVRVWRTERAGRLVLSGGAIGGLPAEAALMRELALAAGVPDDRIVIEDLSRNTFENAVYAGAIIRLAGWRRVVVVTDQFHLPRALYIFRRIGLAVEGAGVPRQPGVSRGRWLRFLIEEKLRHLRAAQLFWIGAHRPLLSRVWDAPRDVRDAPRGASRDASRQPLAEDPGAGG
jgi:uncharacterized SAM-binding protein YcdF (DUF218 family)